MSNLSPFEITQEKYISEELYAEIKEYQPQKGEILLSKDATPGIAYHLSAEPEKMIPAGGILRLKTKTDKIGNEYLTLVLNSILTQEQINRDVGGSVILHWRPDQVAGTVIPILHQEKQAEIQQKVIESFNFRKHAKDLLEHAKRAVEIAIEQDEQTAINWLEVCLTGGRCLACASSITRCLLSVFNRELNVSNNCVASSLENIFKSVSVPIPVRLEISTMPPCDSIKTRSSFRKKSRSPSARYSSNVNSRRSIADS